MSGNHHNDGSGNGSSGTSSSGDGGYLGQEGQARDAQGSGMSSLLSPRFLSPGAIGHGHGYGYGYGGAAPPVGGLSYFNDDCNSGSSSGNCGESSFAGPTSGDGGGGGDGDAVVNNHGSHGQPMSKRPLCHSWSYAAGNGKLPFLSLIPAHSLTITPSHPPTFTPFHLFSPTFTPFHPSPPITTPRRQ